LAVAKKILFVLLIFRRADHFWDEMEKSQFMKAIEEVKQNLRERVDSLKGQIIDIADYLHQNPELGYAEYKACERLTLELEKSGFKVNRGVAGLPTAFRAVFQGKKERPVVGILAEYDALPDLGHACGHNLSGASAVGAALALAQWMPELPGTLMVFGTPAEEGVVENAGGKVVMLEEFKVLDAAMIMHALDMNTVFCDSFNREALKIEFLGRAANAGNAEDSSRGINALEGAMLFWHAINSLRLLLKNDARIFGIITEGGVSPNMIPARAVTKLQIRVEDPLYFREVVKKVEDAARGAALAIGAQVQIKASAHTYVNMRNNHTLAETFKNNLVSLGMQVENLSRRGVATDMGNVSQVVPAIHPFIAAAPRGTAWHSAESARAACSPQAHEAAINAAKAFGLTAIDLFFNPDLVRRVKEEFDQAVGEKRIP
jgi:amidohydrolase